MTHRALILAALSHRPCTVSGWLDAADTRSTLDCLGQFGARWSLAGEGVHFIGGQLPGSTPGSTPTRLECGNSGTTLRLMLGLAATRSDAVQFQGDESLSRRPNSELLTALRSGGASWEGDSDSLPGILRGPISPGHYEVDASRSSQFASSLLLALSLLEGESSLRVRPPIRSRPYLEMTVGLLRSVGVPLECSEGERGVHFVLGGGTSMEPETIAVERDWSSAAFPLVASMLSGRSLVLEDMKRDSVQGDRAVADLLGRFGGAGTWEGAHFAFAPGPIRPAGVIDLRDTPDLFPALAMLAAVAPGETTFVGAEQLRFKESDRIQRVVDGLKCLGVHAKARNDGALIRGGQVGTGLVETGLDHRILMAFECLALVSRDQITTNGRGAEQVSYPGFFDDLASFRDG